MRTKLLVTCLFLIAILKIDAQISIAQSDISLIGSKFLFAEDTTVTTSPGGHGANQTWNLTTLKFQKTDTMDIISPAGTPSASTFPTANIVERTNQSLYTTPHTSWLYFNSNPDSLVYQGFYQNTAYGTVVSNPAPIVAKFPSTYGTSYSASYITNLVSAYPVPPYDSVKIKITDNYTVVVDGYGSLTTPYTTYPNTLRQKQIDNEIDSEFVHNGTTKQWTGSFLSNGSDSVINWWAKGVGYPIVAQINFNKGNTNSNYLISSTTTGVHIGLNYGKINIFPNPFSKQTTVSLDLEENSSVHMVIYNSLGQEISMVENNTLQNGNHIYNLNLDKKGIYFLHTVVNGAPTTQKLIQIE